MLGHVFQNQGPANYVFLNEFKDFHWIWDLKVSGMPIILHDMQCPARYKTGLPSQWLNSSNSSQLAFTSKFTLAQLLEWRQGVAPDYISAFACTGGIGCHEQRQKFEAKGEIDKAILLEAGVGSENRVHSEDDPESRLDIKAVILAIALLMRRQLLNLWTVNLRWIK